MAISLEERSEAQRALGIAEELQPPWLIRNEQWAKDRRLLLMSYKKRMMPFELILSNDIAVQHAFTVAILGGKPPQFRLPISVQDQTERDKMSRSERLVGGIWREMEKSYRMQGHGSLLHDIIFFSGLGSFCMFPRAEMVKVGRRNVPRFYMTLYDPINCYPEFGEGGLLRFARVYHTTYEDAKSLAINNGWDADKIEKSEDVMITNLWEREESANGTKIFNTVIVGGAPLKPRFEHDEFDNIPIIMAPLNGIPMQPYMAAFDQQSGALGAPAVGTGARMGAADWGRPVFHMNRELVPALDRNLTYSAEISRRTALGKYIHISEGGMETMSPSEFDRQMVLNLQPGEDFRAVTPPSGPRERETIIQELQAKIQQASLSRLVFGQLDLEISGVTLERAITQARSILQPYVNGIEEGIADAMTSIMAQVKRKRISTISVATRQAALGPEMGFLVEDFDVKEDLPDTTNLRVTLPMNLPDNRMNRLTMARIAKPGNEPLLPDRAVREDYLEVQDEAMMERLLDEDAAKRSPAILAVKQMAGLRRIILEWEQDDDKTEEEIDEARAALAVMRAEFRQVIAPREQPSTSQQASQAEPSPEVRPTEESAVSPGEAAIVGTDRARLNAMRGEQL
tara:strand:- start:1867 stop:3747 length:1881 start_codon:yes stop_codon:yes gene_type:complete